MTAQNSLDVNFITLRKIYGYDSITNKKPPPQTVLTMTSTGEARWLPAVGGGGSSLPAGEFWSDYLFWNNVSQEWTVGKSSLHLGSYAGQTGAGSNGVALGYYAGNTGQGNSAVAIGNHAGHNNQGLHCIAIGTNAASIARTIPGYNSIAVGYNAGEDRQGANNIAIGTSAGQTNQSGFAVAIGNLAGQGTQGQNAVAIGNSAGSASQGQNAIAIGNSAGVSSQAANSIALNASFTPLNPATSGFFVNPVATRVTNVGACQLYIDGVTNEIFQYCCVPPTDASLNMDVIETPSRHYIFTVRTTGGTDLKYAWYFVPYQGMFLPIPGVTTAVYAPAPGDPQNEGATTIICIVTNPCGNAVLSILTLP